MGKKINLTKLGNIDSSPTLVKTGLRDYLNCCKSESEKITKNRFLIKGEETLDKDLNIVDHINHKEELFVIKELLFTPDERDVIRQIASTSIFFDTALLKKEEFNNMRESLIKFFNDDGKNQSRKDTIRKELYDMLEKKVYESLDNYN